MENVYTDLRLDEEFDHPDNRGWMNLFRHWAWSGMFRVTWAVCIANYGTRFQQFCQRHLSLDIGELKLAETTIAVGAEDWGKAINLLEKEHIYRVIAEKYASSANDLMGSDVDKIAEIANDWIYNNLNNRPLRIRLLEMHVSDPVGKEKDFVFPVGFVLLETDATETEWHLVYIRIQDHLRQVGLGRKSLQKLNIEPYKLGQIIREGKPIKLEKQ